MICKYISIKQYNAPQKQLITIDDIPFCIARSPAQASKILSYLEGFSDGSDLTDGKIKKMCDSARAKHA